MGIYQCFIELVNEHTALMDVRAQLEAMFPL